MINFEALFKISYGLYIVCSGDKNLGNGFISNSVFQITSEPATFAACCNKDNYTAEFIQKFEAFSVSVLNKDTPSDIYGRFGYKSGKGFNKLEVMNVKYGITGVPVVLNESVSYIECQVVQKFDVGTHWLFIGELIDAQIIDETKEPVTYAYYRQVKNAVAPKNAPTYIDKSKLVPKPEPKPSRTYQCSVCGYIYDESTEGVKYSDLPDYWTCPVCGADKEEFTEVPL